MPDYVKYGLAINRIIFDNDGVRATYSDPLKRKIPAYAGIILGVDAIKT
jgi:hypothetical protein